MPEDATDSVTDFPKGFLWGASTSAYQVEGGNHSQWTVWELSHASHQAKTAQQRYGHLANWESIKHQAQDPLSY
jgi:beta-glucosidase/6-phospho-beta-glucosidase/beta-galactosidase